MPKPVAVVSNTFTRENNELIEEHFEVYRAHHPDAEVLFVRYGFQDFYDLHDIMPKLKYVVSNTTNPPNLSHTKVDVIYLDDPAALLWITSTPEHTLGLIMAAHRNLVAAHKSVDKGSWWRYDFGAPKMLSLSTIGIIGYPGRIARALGRMTRHIFERTVGYDEYLPATPNSIIEQEIDVLAICASYKGRTIVTREILEALPSDAIVVNTSDGRNLNTLALIDLLRAKKLRGAALDVYPHDWELNCSNQHYIAIREYIENNDNLIMTPHIAGSTKDAWEYTQRIVIDEVIRRFK